MNKVSINRVVYKTAEYYGIPVIELVGKSSNRLILKARAIICYILHNSYSYPFVHIARALQLTPQTVITADKKAKSWFNKPWLNKKIIDDMHSIESSL